MWIRFIKDAGGYKKNVTLDIENITARVLIHRGYAVQAAAPGAPAPDAATETPAASTGASAAPAAPRAPRAPAAKKPPAAPKKTPVAKKAVNKAPANRAMTAKKTTGGSARPKKKNEYETKGLHAKDAGE